MQMKALKVRIYPTADQADFLNQQFGAVRKVWNKGIAILQNQYKRHGKNLRAKYDLKSLLPVAKKSRKYLWLKDYDSTSLQQSLINLDKAYISFFQKKSGYPRFKNMYQKQSSFHSSASIGSGENWIKIGKLKTPIKAKIHRKVTSRISSITISRDTTGKYYAALCFSSELQPKIATIKNIKESKVLGVDVGISHLLIDSNGKKEDNPRFLKNSMTNLRRKQKNLSRKEKGSSSRKKARLLVAKCHEKLSNTRNDYQHKISKALVDENQAIIVETLKIKNMVKNRKLSKHISDASWGMLIDKIRYKSEESGKQFKKIDQWYASSKTCHVCNYKNKEMKLDMRKWICPDCGSTHDRDINAAINIKLEGLIMLKAEGLSVSAN